MFKYGKTKQRIRDRMVELFNETNSNEKPKLLTLPSIEGVTNKDSFENKVLRQFPSAEIMGIERDKRVFKLIKRSETIKVVNTSALRHLKHCSDKYSMVWLDFCNGLTPDNDKCINYAFKNMIFDINAKTDPIFALTLCTAERIRHTESYTKILDSKMTGSFKSKLHSYINQIAHRYLQKLDLIESIEYKNTDLSATAYPMITIAFKVKADYRTKLARMLYK